MTVGKFPFSSENNDRRNVTSVFLAWEWATKGSLLLVPAQGTLSNLARPAHPQSGAGGCGAVQGRHPAPPVPGALYSAVPLIWTTSAATRPRDNGAVGW